MPSFKTKQKHLVNKIQMAYWFDNFIKWKFSNQLISRHLIKSYTNFHWKSHIFDLRCINKLEINRYHIPIFEIHADAANASSVDLQRHLSSRQCNVSVRFQIVPDVALANRHAWTELMTLSLNHELGSSQPINYPTFLLHQVQMVEIRIWFISTKNKVNFSNFCIQLTRHLEYHTVPIEKIR